MNSYETPSHSYAKIITPLLNSKKVEVTNNTNSNSTISYESSFPKSNCSPSKESVSLISINQFSNLDYYEKRKIDYKPNDHVKVGKLRNNEEWDQLNCDCDNTDNIFCYESDKDNLFEEFNEIKNERDAALQKITKLKEANKILNCKYGDAMAQLREYEKINYDLEQRINSIEFDIENISEYKNTANQMEAVMNQYQEELTQLSEQMDQLANDNLQLENTNKRLLNDLKEINRTNNKLKANKKIAEKRMQVRSLFKRTQEANLQFEPHQRVEHFNSNLSVIQQIESENSEMTKKVDEIEHHLDSFCQNNNLQIVKDGICISNDTLYSTAQTLFGFVNNINDILKKEQISFPDYMTLGNPDQLTASLDVLKQALSYSLEKEEVLSNYIK